MADYSIKLGTELDTSGIDKKVKNYNGNVEVGSTLDTSGITKTLNAYKPKPLNVNTKLSTTGLTKAIKNYKAKDIRVKIDPVFDGIDGKIESHTIDTPLKVKVQLNWTGVKGQIASPTEDLGRIYLDAELNDEAIGKAIRDYKATTPIKVDIDPQFDEAASKISSYQMRNMLHVNVKLNKTAIDSQIKNFQTSKYIEVGAKLRDNAIENAITKYTTKELVPIAIDFKVGDNKEVSQKISEYKNTPVDIPVKLIPAKTGFSDKITNTPVKVSATVDPADIRNDIETAVGGYTPTTKMPVNIKLTMPKDINSQVKGLGKPTEPIDVNVRLDESNINADIALFKPTATLGIQPDLIIENVDDQIRAYVPKTPLKVNVKIDDDAINAATGKNGSQTPITVNVQLNPEKLDEQIKSFKTAAKVKVGVQLDPHGHKDGQKGVSQQIKEIKTKSKIKVGVELDKDDIAQEIAGTKIDTPIKLGVELDTEPVKAEIEKLKSELQKFGKITINFGNSGGAGNVDSSGGNGGSISNVAHQFREVDIQIAATKAQLGNLKKALSNVGFSKGSIDTITKEFNDLGISVRNVTSRLRDDGSVTLTVKGIDQFERAVKVMKSVDEKGNITNLGTTISQDFKEAENAFKRLKTLGKEISQLDIKIAGLDADKNKQEITELINQLNRLEAEYNDLFNITEKNLNARQIDELAQDIANTSNKIDVIKAKFADTTAYNKTQVEIKETEEAFKKLINIGKQIDGINLKISGLDGSKNANEIVEFTRQLNVLEQSYRNLRTSLQGKLSSDQLSLLAESAFKAEDKIKLLNAEMADTTSINNQKQAFVDLMSVLNELNSKKKELNKIDISSQSSSKNAKTLLSQVQQLENEYQNLLNAFKSQGIQFTAEQWNQIENAIAKTGRQIDVVQSKMSDKSAIQSQTQAYKELLSISKEISSLEINIEKLKLQGGNSSQIKTLENQLRTLQSTYQQLATTMSTPLTNDQWGSIYTQIAKTSDEIEKLKAKHADARAEFAKEIKTNIGTGKLQKAVNDVKESFSLLRIEDKNMEADITRLQTLLGNMDASSDIESVTNDYQDFLRLLQTVKNNVDELQRTQSNSSEMLDLKKESAMAKLNNLFEEGSQAAKVFGTRAKELARELNECGNANIDNVTRKVSNLGEEVKKSHLQTKTFGTRLKEQFSKYSSYFSVASVFMYATQAARSMFEQVKLIDSAMTELKKVTDETDASYNKFLSNAATRAKEIGTTIDGLVSSTADFARLGYGFEDSQKLAEVANIYAVVGDEIDGVEGATQSLVSTMAAFKDEINGMSDSDFALGIVDKMNEVSNNFAISSGGIGEALQRSASSMAAANNSLDETIAMITAANEVAQNPEKVGNAMKTMSMRIRAAKSELEDAGESTEGMAESTASLRAEIKALSGVDIMLND